MESLQARLREEGEKTGFSSEVGPAQAFFGQFAEVIVLGLGSVDNEFTSRFQLAFALELSRHFGGVPIRIRDPCFRDADQKILHSLGCQVRISNSWSSSDACMSELKSHLLPLTIGASVAQHSRDSFCMHWDLAW